MYYIKHMMQNMLKEDEIFEESCLLQVQTKIIYEACWRSGG